MSEYYWDQKIEYLRKTRWLYYNDDYLEFLVKGVWKIDKPVNIIDYGCGYGFLGLKLLPLLPKGSTYTGVDKGTDLIQQAKNLFQHLPYSTEFKVIDIEEMDPQPMYDIAMCHAFLLHMTDSRKIVQKMIDHVKNDGKVICFEPHWIANSANYYMDGLDQSQYIRLGILQKLFEEDTRQNGKNGNIGLQLPVLLSQLGLKNVECRVSDKVNFLDQNMDAVNKEKLFDSLQEEGLGKEPECLEAKLNNLMNRGLTQQEVNVQYESELRFSREFGLQSWLTYAPNMKISFGSVQR